MQELKHCKIAQGLEIANKQQQGAVGYVLGGGGRGSSETLLPVYKGN